MERWSKKTRIFKDCANPAIATATRFATDVKPTLKRETALQLVTLTSEDSKPNDDGFARAAVGKAATRSQDSLASLSSTAALIGQTVSGELSTRSVHAITSCDRSAILTSFVPQLFPAALIGQTVSGEFPLAAAHAISARDYTTHSQVVLCGCKASCGRLVTA